MTKEDEKETVSTVTLTDIDPDISSGAYMGFEGSFGVGGNDSNLDALTITTDTATPVTFNDGQATITLTIPTDGLTDLHGGYTTAPISAYNTDVITVTNEDIKPAKSLLCEDLTSENYLEGQQGDLFDGWDNKD